MNMRDLWIIVSKEVGDAVRDRRAVMAGLLFALLGPMVLAAALKAMIATERDGDDVPVHLVGAQRAPGLAAYLRENGIALHADEGAQPHSPGKPPGSVVLVVPESAPGKLAQGRTATIELWADMANGAARRSAERVRQLASAYGAQLAEQRLLGAGVAPAAARPLAIDVRDLSSQGSKSALVLGMLPVFWLLGVFVGGSHVALDVTGGERERRSLEALLAQPVAPWALFAGKWLATALFGYLTSAAALLLSALVLARLPLYELGIAFSLDGGLLACALLVLLPLALLVAALQCVLPLRARSHKEAQTYLNLLQLLPMVLVIDDVGGPRLDGAHLLPMLGQQDQLTALLAGQPLMAAPLAASAVLCLGAAGLLAWAGSRRLGSERFVFGL